MKLAKLGRSWDGVEGLARNRERAGYQRWPIRVGLVFISLAIVVATALPTAASGLHAKKLTPLQKGLAFYKGQTLTFYTTVPGGSLDLAAEDMAPYLTAYLHLAGVNILPENTPSEIGEGDTVAAASPNGLTIGFLQLSAWVEDLLTTGSPVNFNPAREEYVAATGAGIETLVASTSSGLTSIPTIKDDTTPPKVVSATPGGGSSILAILFGLLGLQTQFLGGYGSVTAVEEGFARGDGQLSIASIADEGPFLAGGTAKAIATSVPSPAGGDYSQYLKGVPTFAQLLTQYLPHPSKSLKAKIAVLEAWDILGNPIVTQTKVSSDKLLALRAAFAWANSKSSFRKAMLTSGNAAVLVKPVQAKDEFLTLVNVGKTVACYITKVPGFTGAC